MSIFVKNYPNGSGSVTLRSDREELLHSRGTNIFFHYYSVRLLKIITVINHIRFSYHGSKSFQASELTKF